MQSKKSNRLASLDLARVLAMLMMIQGHTIYATANPSLIDTSIWYWDIWSFLRGFTAPVFLTVSGAVHVFANKRDEYGRLSNQVAIRRINIALLLLFVGYMLVFPAGRIYDVFFVEHKYWLNFYKVNILQLFGSTLLLALALFYFTRKNYQLMIGSLILAGFFTFSLLLNEQIASLNLPAFFNAYFSFENGSLFPMIPYSAYFFIGVFFGGILKNMDSEKRPLFFLKWGLPIGIVLLAVALPFSGNKSSLWEMVKGFSRDNPAIVLQREAFVMFGLFGVALLHFLLKNSKKSI